MLPLNVIFALSGKPVIGLSWLRLWRPAGLIVLGTAARNILRTGILRPFLIRRLFLILFVQADPVI
ncbi:hypothetical protein ASC80_05645 [Afipia sp. Root123D2]|nr:hypothetical protein ASC80_05645 [Afipia sp. Root123D2]